LAKFYSFLGLLPTFNNLSTFLQVFFKLIKVGELLIHSKEGNARENKVTRALEVSIGARKREISRVQETQWLLPG